MGRALSSRCSTKARFSPRDRVLHGGFWELPDWMISGKPFKTHHWRPWEWSDESNQMIKVHLLTGLLSFKNTKQNIVQTSTMVDIKFYSKIEPFLALTWPNVISLFDQNDVMPMVVDLQGELFSRMMVPFCKPETNMDLHEWPKVFRTEITIGFPPLDRSLWPYPSQHLLDFQGTCFKAKLFGKPGMVTEVAMGVIGSWELINFWNRNIKNTQKLHENQFPSNNTLTTLVGCAHQIFAMAPTR